MSRYLTTALALVASATAHCTREGLTESVNAYLSAQTTGQTAAFQAHFDNATWLGYYENAAKLPLNSSILTTPLSITHTRSIYDTINCATFTEAVVNSTATPYVLGTQLRFANHAISKVDTIVTKPGDWLFNITGYAYWTEQEKWDTIPAAQRDTPATLKKAADAYLDVFSNPNVTVPWGTPCVRLEGGLYGDAGPNGTCAGGVPSGVPLTNRRYVVDDTVGAVDVLVSFGQSKWPDSHEFRIEGGKIRYVHTMTHCATPNCGLSNGTAFFGRKY